jgi:tetratricopeptide (TPR) repeat protein
MPSGPSAIALVVLATVLLAPAGRAQDRGQDLPPPAQAGLRSERQGRLDEAAELYASALDESPDDVTALLGLERVLRRLGRLPGMRPYAARAVDAQPGNEMIRELEFRIVTAMEDPDTVAAVVSGWTASLPDSPKPYREWAFWLARRGDVTEARRVLARGQARVGEQRLAADMGRLLVAAGEWPAATRQWRLAVSANAALLPAAGLSLERAPLLEQEVVLRVLYEGDAKPAQWLAADLLVRWGRAEEGWTVLDASLPSDAAGAAGMLRRFADGAGQRGGPGDLRAKGYALERLAQYRSGADANRARLEAARAFADAGELGAARRMLDRIGIDASAESVEGSAAMAALVRVLAESGRLDEAEQRFRDWESRLHGDDAAQLRLVIAWARVNRGELDRAEALLAGDSSVAGLAVSGWVALYRGELAEARARFRAAGPYARTRAEITRRSAMLVLLERVSADRLPVLGAALLDASRGDSSAAVRGLEMAANALPPRGGRADVLAYAGTLAASATQYDAAESLLLAALAADPDGPAAPASEYALAEVYWDTGRRAEAAEQLEHLILGYPESAVVPQARRLLDQVRGQVPRS